MTQATEAKVTPAKKGPETDSSDSLSRLCQRIGLPNIPRFTVFLVSLGRILVKLVWPYIRGYRTMPASGTTVGGLPSGRGIAWYRGSEYGPWNSITEV